MKSRKVKQVMSGDYNQWEGEDIRKGGFRKVNTVDILFTHV
jgi:hypothetical protein